MATSVLPATTRTSAERSRAGWRMAGAISAIILATATAITFGVGGTDGARLAIRVTARTSVVLYLLAFSAAPLHRFWPGPLTRWLRQNRRYLGVAFGGSHLGHAIAITALLVEDPALFHRMVPPLGLFEDVIGLWFIAAMVATSFDRTAALLGTGAWRWLHALGGYVIWFVFAKSYFPRAMHKPFFVPFAALLIVGLALRVAAAVAARRAALPRLAPASGSGDDGATSPALTNRDPR